MQPDIVDLGAALEPPDYVEMLADVRDAPLGALLREALKQYGDFPGDGHKRAHLRLSLREWLASIPVAEVDLAPEEYAALNEPPSE